MSAGVPRGEKFIRELKHARFWDADGNRKRRFRLLGPYCLPDFLYYSSLMKKRYLAMWIWLCADKLKVKVAHFRLPSASQKRAYLSSLVSKCLGSSWHTWTSSVNWPVNRFPTREENNLSSEASRTWWGFPSHFFRPRPLSSSDYDEIHGKKIGQTHEKPTSMC